jgi:NADPH:quinone reductase-like Zn-dependent oxidoreductase
VLDPVACDTGLTVGAAVRRGRGELTTTVAAVFPFAEAAQAHQLVDSGHAGGKVVLVP